MEDATAPLIRTAFSDDAAWRALQAEVIAASDMGFEAQVRPVSDAAYAGADLQELAAANPDAPVLFVADARAMDVSEILCVDPEDPTKTFRAAPCDLWIVENNISTGNLMFEELLEQVDENGVLIAEM